MIQLFVSTCHSLWAKDSEAVTLSPGSFPNPTQLAAGGEEMAQPHHSFCTQRGLLGTEHEWEATEVLKDRKNRKMGRKEEKKRWSELSKVN